MKKFLTVLLALSVVFTYTVGTAFAADPVPGDTLTHDQAVAQAQKELSEEVAKAVSTAKGNLASEYTEDFGAYKAHIAGTYYSQTLDQIATDLGKVIKEAAIPTNLAGVSNSTDVAEIKDAMKAVETKDIVMYKDAYLTVKYSDLFALITTVTAAPAADLAKHYTMLTWQNALTSMKNEAKAEIEKIDMSLYTSDVADKDDPYQKTWAQLALEAKNDLLKTVNDTAVDMVKDDFDDATASITAMYATKASLTKVTSVTTTAGVEIVLTYKLADSTIKTKDDLDDDKAETDADKATLKAEVKSKAAAATKTALETYNAAKGSDPAAAKAVYDTSLKQIAAFEEVWNFLIDEEDAKATSEEIKKATADDAAWTTITDIYEKYVGVANTLKIQVEKDGSLTYDAAVINKNLAAEKVKIYNGTTSSFVEATAKAALADDAKVKTTDLAWEKEVALAAINKEMKETLYDTDGSDLFYAPEKTKMEAEYQKIIDKINAATTSEQLKAANKKTADGSTRYVAAKAFADKETVVADIESRVTPVGDFIDAVNNYVDHLNYGIKPYEDGYRNTITKTGDDLTAVAEFLAENGARTNNDINGLNAKAKDYATALPTIGEAKAAREKVDAMVKALPTVITLADKDAVAAAAKAADEIGYTSTTLTNAIALVKAAEEKVIADMIKALPAKITVADKDAVKALEDAVKAYEETSMYDAHEDYDITATLAALRDAELAAVQDMIASLPADATKAQVEAARAAVDAFIAEYNDAETGYKAVDHIVNMDKLAYAEAQAKAKVISAVEGLKIVASSKLYKGKKIQVKWRIADGDTSAIDGYQVYKSTKANSGYKFMGKTKKLYMDNKKSLKKGTRYFYKVRAYVDVDGTRYYSDWSNKANRIYKK